MGAQPVDGRGDLADGGVVEDYVVRMWRFVSLGIFLAAS
jgi:hypothetical protein